MGWFKRFFSYDFDKLICPRCGWSISTELAAQRTITDSISLFRTRCPKCNTALGLKCPECQKPLQPFRLWSFTWQEGFLGIRICQNCGCAVNKQGKKLNSKFANAS
jgi:hypothetical protein